MYTPMVLVDTSVWVDYLRSGDNQLQALLERSKVCMHPMISGELACGHLKHRARLLAHLDNLPCSVEATHKEVMHCLESNKLMGRGIGYVDLHLLASTLLSDNTQLWTRDIRLKKIADELKTSMNAS